MNSSVLGEAYSVVGIYSKEVGSNVEHKFEIRNDAELESVVKIRLQLERVK